MVPVDTQRLRVALRPPQVVRDTDAIVWWPRRPASGLSLLLAHGAGSDLTDPVLRAVSRALAERGVPIMAFAFPYATARLGRPDPMPRLEAAYRDVIAVARQQLGGRPLAIGGRSLGGRVASHLAAAGEDVAGLALLGYPLHPAGRPDRLRTDHWDRLVLPTLMVSGDRDRLCDLELLEREVARMAVAPHVHVVGGADHAFAVRKRDGRDPADVIAEIVQVTHAWLVSLGHPRLHSTDQAPA